MSTFRHVLMVRFRDDVLDDQIDAMLEGLGTLPGLIPEIAGYSFGLDIGIREGNPDFGLVADFASETDWRAYQEHPDHVEVVNLVNAVAGEKTSMQFVFHA